jgi:putative ABC transport system permease protein
VAVSIFAGLLFGLAPAVRLSKLDVNSTLKDGGRGATGGASGKRLSALLVTAEIAATIVLLAGAGLMARSFLKIYTEDVGVDAANILAASVPLPATRYPDAQSKAAFVDRVTTKLKSIPGIVSVAVADVLPGLVANSVLPYELAGSTTADASRRPKSIAITITPDYFRTVGASVISGRDFNDFDRSSTAPVALVNESFAREHWPGVNPLGKRLRLFDFYGRNADAWRTVVGVTSNIVQAVSSDSGGIIYVPYRQRPPASRNYLMRTRIPSDGLAVSVRDEIRSIDSGLDIGAGSGVGVSEGPLPLTESFKVVRYWSRAVDAGLFLTFAFIALLIAAIGLYAVIAHSVSRATQEIGIRIAIGATSRDIRLLVLRQGMLPVVTGLATGLAASAGFNRLLQSQLFSVTSTDPTTYAVTSMILIAVALTACLIPAHRAMRVDPAVALRHE